jgi:RNA polymerase sigma factor (sigma-70 family)
VDDDSQAEGTTLLDNVPDTLENPYQASARRRLGKDLEECLDRIDGALREVFVLRELEELKLEEIAAAVGASIVTAHRWVAKAKIGLRECLGNKGYGQEAIA